MSAPNPRGWPDSVSGRWLPEVVHTFDELIQLGLNRALHQLAHRVRAMHEHQMGRSIPGMPSVLTLANPQGKLIEVYLPPGLGDVDTAGPYDRTRQVTHALRDWLPMRALLLVHSVAVAHDQRKLDDAVRAGTLKLEQVPKQDLLQCLAIYGDSRFEDADGNLERPPCSVLPFETTDGRLALGSPSRIPYVDQTILPFFNRFSVEEPLCRLQRP